MPKQSKYWLYGYAVKTEWLMSYSKRNGLVSSPNNPREVDPPSGEVDRTHETLSNAISDILGKAGFVHNSMVGLYQEKEDVGHPVLAIGSSDPKDGLPLLGSGRLPAGKRLEKLKSLLNTEKEPKWYPCL